MGETPRPAPDEPQQMSTAGCLGLLALWIVVTLLIFYGAITNKGIFEFVLTALFALLLVGVGYGAWTIGRKAAE